MAWLLKPPGLAQAQTTWKRRLNSALYSHEKPPCQGVFHVLKCLLAARDPQCREPCAEEARGPQQWSNDRRAGEWK